MKTDSSLEKPKEERKNLNRSDHYISVKNLPEILYYMCMPVYTQTISFHNLLIVNNTAFYAKNIDLSHDSYFFHNMLSPVLFDFGKFFGHDCFSISSPDEISIAHILYLL